MYRIPSHFELIERIYDPELGPGVSSTQAIAKYLNKPNSEDYYMSFTKLPKIGINPRSGYETPLGIYTYPIVEFFTLYQPNKNSPIGDSAPFAGSSPYIHIVKRLPSSGRFIEDISVTYDVQDYIKDLRKIVRTYQREIVTADYLSLIGRFFREELKDAGYSRSEWEKDYENVAIEALRRVGFQSKNGGNVGGQFWFVTFELSKLLGGGKGKSSTVQWNKLMRELGYAGVADKSSEGIIHPSEPMQAVFFHKSAFELLEQIDNVGISQVYSQETVEFIAKGYSGILDTYIIEGSVDSDSAAKIIDEAKILYAGSYYSAGAAAPMAMAHMMQKLDGANKIESNPEYESPYKAAADFFSKFVDAIDESKLPQAFIEGWNSMVYSTEVVKQYRYTTFTFQSPTVQPSISENGRSDYRL